MEEQLYLIHYGTPRHSGRYPWGSGKSNKSPSKYKNNNTPKRLKKLKVFKILNAINSINDVTRYSKKPDGKNWVINNMNALNNMNIQNTINRDMAMINNINNMNNQNIFNNQNLINTMTYQQMF